MLEARKIGGKRICHPSDPCRQVHTFRVALCHIIPRRSATYHNINSTKIQSDRTVSCRNGGTFDLHMHGKVPPLVRYDLVSQTEQNTNMAKTRFVHEEFECGYVVVLDSI